MSAAWHRDELGLRLLIKGILKNLGELPCRRNPSSLVR